MNIFASIGGIHPPSKKQYTENSVIEKMAVPKRVYISLLQHIGTPLEPIVRVGETVRKGQKIAESDAEFSVPVHSSVSGKVAAIENHPFPLSGMVKTIIIDNDEKETEIEFKGIDINTASKEEILYQIKNCGIVGMGGAQFPTHIKLNPKTKIELLIANGAECEPYLNSDNRLMIEYPTEITEGLKIIMKILDAEKCIVAIEDNKNEAIEKMREVLAKESNLTTAVLETKYPQGGEKQLIKSVSGKVVPCGRLPADIGIIVVNVSTAKAVYDAVIKGVPLIERVVTVSGKGVLRSGNYMTRIGTRFEELCSYAKIDIDKTEKIISGGPMMGIAQYSLEVPVIKGTSGILAMTLEELKPHRPKSCISCAKCVDACPMGLLPVMYAKYAEFEEWEKMKRVNLMDCIECGSCAYTCPARRPLTEAIKIGKAKLRMKKEIVKERG